MNNMRGARLLLKKFLTLFCFVVLLGLSSVLSGPVKERITEEVTWKKDDIVFPNETLVTCNVSKERDVLAKNDSSSCSSCERQVHIYFISVIVVSLIAGIELIIILIVLVVFYHAYVSRKSSDQYSGLLHYEEPYKDHYSGLLHYEESYKGRISYYELVKLVRYAFVEKEDDKLEDAMKSLMNNNTYEIPKSRYGSTDKNQYLVYQDLCGWKKQCDKPRVNQIELLYEKCIAADMVESIRKLKDLRGRVSDVPSSFSVDLKRILLWIGNKSTDNITNLLKNLNVENVDYDHSSGLEEIVDGALEKLEIWKEGLVPINPVVMFILALEDLKLNEGQDEHFRDLESISFSLE